MKILTRSLLVFLVLVLSKSAFSQNYQSQQSEIFAYNLLSNGLICGISGAINKDKGEKAFPTFLKNFGKGCLGGFIKYSAKKQSFYLRYDSHEYLAPINRAYFFLGHSVSMNASLNKRTFENFYFNFYGVDFNFRPYEEKGNRFSGRLSMGTVTSVIYFSALGHKLDFFKSLEYGQFFFELDPDTKIDGISIAGLASYNSFAIEKDSRGVYSQSVIPHEMVHNYQYYDFFTLSSFYQAKLDTALNEVSLYRKASKFLNFDYQPIFFSGLYNIQPKPRYYRNYFEYEAEHFGRRRFINR